MNSVPIRQVFPTQRTWLSSRGTGCITPSLKVVMIQHEYLLERENSAHECSCTVSYLCYLLITPTPVLPPHHPHATPPVIPVLPSLARFPIQERIPIMSVVGEKEVTAGTLAVRSRGTGDMGDVDVDVLLAKMLEADAAACELQDVLEAMPAVVLEDGNMATETA